MTEELVRIWYVSAQKLCNYDCSYCVSVGDYAKSRAEDWSITQQDVFRRVVAWLANQPYRVGLRLGTLGEPFASRVFLENVAWLLGRPSVGFVELVTNGSMLSTHLPRLAEQVALDKLSLWITYHPQHASLERLIAIARRATDEYGVFVVVNALLFPDNEYDVRRCRDAAVKAGLRFNLDLGYTVSADRSSVALLHSSPERTAPHLSSKSPRKLAVALGVNPSLFDLTSRSLGSLANVRCTSGHRYFFIGIHGDVHRCSRYAGLGREPLGSVLEPTFALPIDHVADSPCHAVAGCTNKEDFLHRRDGIAELQRSERSLGWVLPTTDPVPTNRL